MGRSRRHLSGLLAAGILFSIPLLALGMPGTLWTEAGMSFRAAGTLAGDYASHPDRRVSRAALKSADWVADAEECGLCGDGEAFFKAAQKAAKRLEKLRKAARRSGEDTRELDAALEEIVTSANRIIYAGISEVKARGDFLTDDRVVRAAARAEVLVEKARAALTRRKPCARALKACARAYVSLADLL